MNNNSMTQIKRLTIENEDERSWSEMTLDTFIPNHFTKIVSINSRYLFLIGGTALPDLTKPPKKEPENSIFLIDMELEKVLLKKKMSSYRAHSACVLNENYIYIIGGQEIGG
jgi:hypothetical protein